MKLDSIDSRDLRKVSTVVRSDKVQRRLVVDKATESSGSLPEVKLTADLVRALAGDQLS